MMVCSMMMFVFDAHQSSCVKLRWLCMRHLTQPFLESSISYTWITFQSPWWDWSVDSFLMMSCLTYVYLTIFEFFDQFYFKIFVGRLLWTEMYWDLLVMIFGYLWEPMDIVTYFEMHFGCSSGTNAYYDLLGDTSWLLVESWWNFVIYHW